MIDYHERITALYDEYYAAKADDNPTPNKRIDDANALIEQYVEATGNRPPSSVLSRLATYILLDTLTDSHPDKMSREEYPIMSYGQTGRYFARNGGLKDEPYDHGEVIGYADGEAILNPETSEQRANSWRLFIREILTKREALIIERTYEDGATQAEIAEELGISSRWVREIHVNILDKLREIAEK